MRLSTKSSSLRKIVFKKKKVKKPEKSIIQKAMELDHELSYDPISDDESDIQPVTKKINFDLINKLPNLLKDNSKNEVISYDFDEEEEEEEQPEKMPDNDIEIDTENLVKDSLGGKTVFYDFDKNLIYDSKHKVIGTINEDGEMDMETTDNIIENNVSSSLIDI